MTGSTISGSSTGGFSEFRGNVNQKTRHALPEIRLEYDVSRPQYVRIISRSRLDENLLIRTNTYDTRVPDSLRIASRGTVAVTHSVLATHNWYDLTVSGENFEQRFAGRMETSYTDLHGSGNLADLPPRPAHSDCHASVSETTGTGAPVPISLSDHA